MDGQRLLLSRDSATIDEITDQFTEVFNQEFDGTLNAHLHIAVYNLQARLFEKNYKKLITYTKHAVKCCKQQLRWENSNILC